MSCADRRTNAGIGRGDNHPRARRPSRRSGDDAEDAGFLLVEILAAVTILMIVLVSLSTTLVGSLRPALLSKQSEVAASVASDMLENAKALGVPTLIAEPAAGTCPTSLGAVPVPVRTSANFLTCFQILLDSYTYTVTPTLPSGAATGTVNVAVQVTWSSGSYVTTGLVGP